MSMDADVASDELGRFQLISVGAILAGCDVNAERVRAVPRTVPRIHLEVTDGLVIQHTHAAELRARLAGHHQPFHLRADETDIAVAELELEVTPGMVRPILYWDTNTKLARPGASGFSRSAPAGGRRDPASTRHEPRTRVVEHDQGRLRLARLVRAVARVEGLDLVHCRG